MNIKFHLISNKLNLSKKDELYLAKGVEQRQFSLLDVLNNVENPSVSLLTALFKACPQEEVGLVLGSTPFSKIKEIEDVDYIKGLINYNYQNFDGINFGRFLSQEHVLDYANILLSYELSLSDINRRYKEIALYANLSPSHKEHANIVQTLLLEFEETFNTARDLMGGKLTPSSVHFSKNDIKKEESEPNC